MKLNELKKVITKSKKRGRGVAGGGKFFGRGTKGQRSRTSSGNLPTGFEGGQTRLSMRLPKVGGFRPYKKQYFEIVNLAEITVCLPQATKIDKKKMLEAGLIEKIENKVKILGGGEIGKKVEIEADAFSKSAQEKIEKAGGKTIIIQKSKIKMQNDNVKLKKKKTIKKSEEK